MLTIELVLEFRAYRQFSIEQKHKE